MVFTNAGGFKLATLDPIRAAIDSNREGAYERMRSDYFWCLWTGSTEARL